MKVVHVVWSLDERTGGLARAVALITASQQRAGLDVEVVTTGTPSPGLLPPGVAVHSFPRGRLSGRFAGSPGLRDWLRRHLSGDDVVHLHAVWDLASYAGAQAARRVGARTVLSPHGSLEPFDVRKHALAKRLLGPLVVRPTLARATVHCTTGREADCLLTYGARPQVVAVPLPPGPVDPASSASPVGDLRARHGVPTDAPLLLFLGRVDYKKGLTHLVRALTGMTTRAHLVVVGSGDPAYEATVRGLVDELGVADRVHWAGWLDGEDKAAAFRGADLFVLLSDAENYGIAVVEAMQHGAVVVASEEVGSAVDLAAHGAVLLCPRDTGPAAAHLDRYLGDAALREATARAADEVLATSLSAPVVDRCYRDLAFGTPTTVPTPTVRP